MSCRLSESATHSSGSGLLHLATSDSTAAVSVADDFGFQIYSLRQLSVFDHYRRHHGRFPTSDF